MASTNKTTNYELSQFVETDKPAWLTDYNGDMRKLDTALKAVSDVADGASGGISSLTDRMTAAEGGITTNANDIDALEARADALEAQAQSTSGTIANIQTEQTAQNLGIEAATELGYNLARPYDSASTYAVGAYVLFQNTLYKCVTAVSTGEAFDPTKWLAIKATDEISAGGYTLPIASASQLGGVMIGNGLSIDPLTGVLSASGGGTLTPLTSNNITFTNRTVRTSSLSSSAYFTQSTDFPTATSLTPATWRINNESFFYKNNNLRILRLKFGCTFEEASYNSPTVRAMLIDFEIQSDIIDRPSDSESAGIYLNESTSNLTFATVHWRSNNKIQINKYWLQRTGSGPFNNTGIDIVFVYYM